MKIQERFKYGEKKQSMEQRKRTQMPVTEGLAATDKG